MSLKSLKSELSELHEERNTTPEVISVSANGIRFQDPRPLKYCTDYEMLVPPSLKCCRYCGAGLEVLELTEEQKQMFLDPDSGILAENKEDLHRPVPVTNKVDENTRNSPEVIPVTALLTIATVKEKRTTSQRIVYDRFKDITDCPRNTYCKP